MFQSPILHGKLNKSLFRLASLLVDTVFACHGKQKMVVIFHVMYFLGNLQGVRVRATLSTLVRKLYFFQVDLRIDFIIFLCLALYNALYLQRLNHPNVLCRKFVRPHQSELSTARSTKHLQYTAHTVHTCIWREVTPLLGGRAQKMP